MRVATLLIGLGLGLLPSVASAGIETMGNERAESRNCDRPHEQQALWRSQDGEIRLLGEGTRRVEFYGQGIDLTRDVRISGITGASARAIRGVGGLVNAARGCGNIGSLVVEITMPQVASANAGSLMIGNDNVSIKALPLILRDASWHPSNSARSLGTASTATASSSTHPVAGTVNTPCVLPQCNPNQPGSSVQAPRGANGGAAPPAISLGDCLGKLGGSATISGGTLVIQLPRQRNASDMANCASAPIPVQFQYTGANAHAAMADLATATSIALMPTLAVTGPGAPPSFSCIGGTTGSTASPIQKCRLNSAGVGPAAFYSGAALQSVTGSQQHILQFSLSGSTQRLTLVLQPTP